MPLRVDGVYFDSFSTDPTGLQEGQIWYNTTDSKLKYFDGNSVIVLPGDYRFDPGRTIQVAKSGTDYTTIADGITAASGLTPSATNPVTILIYPGTYTEVALTLPEYVSLVAVGETGSTILVPSVVDSPFLTLSGSQIVQGLLFSGATGSDGIAIQLVTASKEATLLDCAARNCGTAFLVSASGAILNCSLCTADASGGNPITTAFYCAGGALMNVVGCQAKGDGTDLITYGYRCEESISKLKLRNIHAYYCTTGIYASNEGQIEGSASCDSCVTSVSMVSSTPHTEISLTRGEIIDSTSWDINLTSVTDGIFNFSGLADETKISIPDAFSNWSIAIIDNNDIHHGYKILGYISIGSKNYPSKAFFGCGSPYFDGITILSNSAGEGGIWVDNTAAAKYKDVTTFSILQGTAVDNCAYFGTDEPFSGLEYGITTAMDPGTGLIIAEYWNGTAWTQFRTMSYEPVYPYDQYAISAFTRVNDPERLNFTSIAEDMETKLLNGHTKYWARVRVTAAITTVPVASWARALPSSTYLDEYGHSIYSGIARQSKTIPWHRNLMDPITGADPNNANLYVSTNITLSGDAVSLADGAVDAKGGAFKVPYGLDTSNPVILTIAWYTDGVTGNAELEVTHADIKNGSVINGSLSDTTISHIIPAATTAYALAVETFEIPVYNLVPGEFKAIKLKRDATNGNPDDTLNDDVFVLDATLSGTFWR